MERYVCTLQLSELYVKQIDLYNDCEQATDTIVPCIVMWGENRVSEVLYLCRLLFDLFQKHFDICRMFPVLCPNNCGVRDIPREKVGYITLSQSRLQISVAKLVRHRV